MDLNDLYKLAGISKDDAPAIEPQPVEQVAEQPTDGSEDMRSMIALITPDQLNQLVGEAPVEEGDEYAASTTPNPREYKGTLGSPSDNSLRRYLGAAGDHVTVDEDVYPDHTTESVSEAYNSFKAKHKTEAYSPGDENEEGMVSNCCGASIMDVSGGHGRCSDCKEMASAVAEVNEDAGKVGYMEMFFTDRDGGEVSQEVQVTLADGKLSVTGDMPGPEDDLYWDDADIEEQLRDAMQDMSVIDFDMNEADSADDEGMIIYVGDQKFEYSDYTLSDAMDVVDEYADEMAGEEYKIYNAKNKLVASGTVGDPSYMEADIDENAFNQAAAAASRAGKDSFEFGGKTHKTTMKKDTAHKLDDDIDVLKQLAGLRLPVTEELTQAEAKKATLDLLVDIAKTSKQYKGEVTKDQVHYLGSLIHDFDALYGIEEEKYSEIEKLFRSMASTEKADMAMIQPAYAQAKTLDEDVQEAGAPDYNPAKASAGGPGYASMPQQVKLAGDSIWDKEDTNPPMVTITDYEVVEEDGYVSVTVEHDGPWTIYTDSGFEKEISEMIGMELSFSEQGMQEDGRAHLEGGAEMESSDLSRLKMLAGTTSI